jgi:hypothetical protein
LFALGKVVDAEWKDLKYEVRKAVVTNPLKGLDWRGTFRSGLDPPHYQLDLIPTVPVGEDPFGYQSSQIYEGYLTPLRL